MTATAQRMGRELTGADLRLAPAALGAWAATAFGLLAPPPWGWLAGGLLALTAAGCLGVRRRWSAATMVALAFGAAAVLLTCTRVAVRDASPLARLAAADVPVELEVTVDDDPRLLPAGPQGAQVLVPATALAVSSAGKQWKLEDDVIVLAEATSWQGLLPGQRIAATGRLLPARGGDLVAAAFAARGPPDLLGRPPPLQVAAGSLRAGLVQAAQVLPPGPRGLLPGLVVGDTSGMDPVLIEQFRATGLTHLVAVSGANCAIVVGAVIWLLRRFGVPRVPLACAAGLALAGFVVLVRPSPSVLRAAAMGAVALLALAAGRPRPAVPALATAILVLVLVSPALALSPGFGLSVAATAGILLLAPRWTRALRARRVPAGVAEAVAVSLAAGMVTAPLIAALSGSVSVVSVPANLLAAPAVPIATVLGVLATLLWPGWHSGAQGLVWLAGFPVRWLVAVAERGAGLPAATRSWPSGLAGAVLLTVVLAVAVVVFGRSPPARRLAAAAGVGVVVLGLPVRLLVDAGWPPPGWIFVACEVGQGDALVVNTGPAQAVLIDTGPDPVAVDACLRGLRVTTIELLVLTHLHADHIDGLAGALHARQVREIEVGPEPELGYPWAEVTGLAAGAGVPIHTAAVGEVRVVGGVRLQVLAPAAAFHGTHSDPNNSSLVLRVDSAGTRVLFTGDVEVEAQQALLRSGVDLRADVLKVAHHGSAYQDGAFLAAVGARLGVISVGRDNDYGHPSAALLDRLQRLGMAVRRTDQDGAVAVGVGVGGGLWVVARARGSPVAP